MPLWGRVLIRRCFSPLSPIAGRAALIRVVSVPLPAGTSPDIRTRMIAEHLTKTWGQQVVVENRPGGGGLAGVQAVLSASSDGYTLFAAPATVYTILPVRTNRPEFDVNRDLVPIALI